MIASVWFVPFFGMEQEKAKDILFKKVGWKKPHEVAELIKDKNKVVLASCYSPDGKMVAGAQGNCLEIWNTSAPYESKQKIKTDNTCFGVTYNHDGKVVVGFMDGVNLFNAETGQIVKRFEQDCCCSEYNPKNIHEIAGVGRDNDKSGIIWDTISGKEITKIPNETLVLGGHYHPEGKSFAVFNANYIRIWDLVAR